MFASLFPAPRVPRLSSLLTTEQLAQRLQPLDQWAWFPPAADRNAWEALLAHPLQQTRRSHAVAEAEASLGQPWPALPATLYMEFARNGDRSRYEAAYFGRRQRLATLAIAECLEGKGRFIDEIANGAWAILEETTWCIPAHAARAEGDPLHRLDLETIDLFAAETAMTLATLRHLLRAELDAVSPTLAERISRETLRRVIEPVETTETFGRSRWLDGHNNWSPWCASNILGAAFLLVEDRTRLAAFARRMMLVVERFIDGYGEDGGCDEGPGYWAEAAGAMLIFLELLHSRTGGAIDIYRDPKIAAMGEFIVSAHVAGPWFVNFADADVQPLPPAGRIYRFGERIGSKALRQLALLAQRQWNPTGPVEPPLRFNGVSRPLLEPLMQLWWIPPEAAPDPGLSLARRHRWLPDLQALFAREAEGDEQRGLYLAAKGGHNAESHNHNDCGHFIVFLDGQPGLIDIGREQYTAATFGPERYQLWFTRGASHTAPVIGGVEQAAGRAFAASEVAFAAEPDCLRLGMNLENAYPAAAGLKSLRREFQFFTSGSPRIEISDALELAQAAELCIPLHTLFRPELVAPGTLAIGCQPRRLILRFDPAFAVEIEELAINDVVLRRNWGERLFRIGLRRPVEAGTSSYRLTLAAES
jgi:hypothetical protein